MLDEVDEENPFSFGKFFFQADQEVAVTPQTWDTPSDPNLITWIPFVNEVHGFKLTWPHSWIKAENELNETLCCLLVCPVEEKYHKRITVAFDDIPFTKIDCMEFGNHLIEFENNS